QFIEAMDVKLLIIAKRCLRVEIWPRGKFNELSRELGTCIFERAKLSRLHDFSNNPAYAFSDPWQRFQLAAVLEEFRQRRIEHFDGLRGPLVGFRLEQVSRVQAKNCRVTTE